MNFENIVNELNVGSKIYDLPLRVTYYCRVSTESDVQLNSLENQLNYYRDYIKSKNKWIFVEGYVEEGVSGVTVNKRDNFKKMIRDARKGSFDLIITKEVSRFARDLEDSIHFIRELKASGVGIYFENQNLNTFDSNSEMILNIMFNLAQEESRKLSARVKFGHKQAIKNGHVLGSSNIIGYKKNNCKLIIVEKEANFIRKVFELYSTGKYGFGKLSKILFNLGYYNKNGQIYDKNTLKRIIQNPKYKGYYRAHQHEIIDYRTKLRKTILKEEQILYKCKDDSVPAIVSEEIWNEANKILLNRSKGYENNNYWSGGIKYAFSSKIYCMEHNTNFQRSHGSRKKNRPTWSCSQYLMYRLSACCSPIIAEKDLYNIMKIVMNSVIPNKNVIINNLLELYSNININCEYDEELKNIEMEIKNEENKKFKVIDLITRNIISEQELSNQFEYIKDALEKKIARKNYIIRQKELLNEHSSNLDKISKSIEEEINGGSLDEFIRKFVDEIIVSKIDNDRYNIKLDIYLNLFGEEKHKIRGARHISNQLTDVAFLENQMCYTIEEKRTTDKPNKFTYNVYNLN